MSVAERCDPQPEGSRASETGAFYLIRPEGHRLEAAIAYHLRAGDSRSEWSIADGFAKAVVLHGAAAEINVCAKDESYAVSFIAERPIPPLAAAEVVTRWLGLTPVPTAFVARFERDSLLGPLISLRPGLRILQLATPFEALAWAITGQQISFAVASRMRRALIELAARETPRGMFAFPDAADVAAVGQDGLRRCGYSRNKARALSELADDVASGRLVIPAALGKEVDLWRDRLRARFGFGPWTVEYALLRGWGHPDADLIGDVVVRKALKAVAQQHRAPRRRTLSAYRPWRSFAACHLWAAMMPLQHPVVDGELA